MNRAVAAVLLVPSLAFAAPPKAVIEGPTTRVPGQICRLDATKSTDGEFFTWIVFVDLADKSQAERQQMLNHYLAELRAANVEVPAAIDDESIIADAGKTLFLPTFPGVYQVAVVVANKDGQTKSKHTVTVNGGPIAPPEPPPDDDPPPKPPEDPPLPPTSAFGFTAVQVGEWLKSVPETKRAQKAALADAFRLAGKQAATGAFDTVAKAEAAGNAAIKAAVLSGKVDYVAWTKFGETVQAAVDGLKATGKIASPQDYGRALLELAEALK